MLIVWSIPKNVFQPPGIVQEDKNSLESLLRVIHDAGPLGPLMCCRRQKLIFEFSKRWSSENFPPNVSCPVIINPNTKISIQEQLLTNSDMNGAYFTKIFHRTLPRSAAAVNHASKKSKDIQSKTTFTTTSPRGVSTQAGTEAGGMRWSLWDQDNLDPEMVSWFFFP